jgi:hypothetical protein
MSDRFVYTLCGGPYNNKQILGMDQEWRVELYHHSTYAQYSTAVAIYGSRVLQMRQSPRLLYFWGSRAGDPRTANEPAFYS